MNRFHALAAAAFCSLAAISGCESTVNEENFDKITIGMGKDQVEVILGEGTREDVGGATISGGGIVGGSPNQATTKTFSWKDGQSQIIIEFKDEKVIAKRKVGF